MFKVQCANPCPLRKFTLGGRLTDRHRQVFFASHEQEAGSAMVGYKSYSFRLTVGAGARF